MSPFASELRKLRFQLGLRQQALAELVGCDRSYLSALENDHRPAPNLEFFQVLMQAMDLSDREAEEFRRARDQSRRTYTLPEDLPPAAYEFVSEVFVGLERLNTYQLDALKGVLQSYLRSSRDGPSARPHNARLNADRREASM